MANDKLVNREVLKEVREKFQQKIENATIVAGQAKAIAPVSEESGTIQETPFINQGTGTANNTELVDTSPVGKQLEKQGNTIVYNQYVNISPLVSAWLDIRQQHFVFQPHSGGYQANIQQFASPIPAGHKILLLLDKRSGSISGTSKIGGYAASTYAYQGYLSFNVPNGISAVTYTATANVTDIRIALEDDTVISEVYDAYVYYIDLTQWFGGNDFIPADLLSHPEHFSWHYNGALTYNLGEIRDCAGRYLVCGQSRNIYDSEETYNRVIPNIEYYYFNSSATATTITYYDNNQNVISTESVSSGSTFTTPSNCIYINSSVTNNITISEYYLTGDGYDKHYPYVPSVTYDTGTEVLRKAGSAKDTKAPDGTITRRIGYVDLGTLSWTVQSVELGIYTAPIPVNAKHEQLKMVCNNYIATDSTEWSKPDKTVSYNASFTSIQIKDLSVTQTSDIVGMLYYELANSTTEQGTAFSENIQIDDYNAMWWLDTSNAYITIPQGTKLFYPADYVLLIDSLNSYTNGDVTSLAKKTDLLPKLSSSSEDGTYMLKAVKSGTTITYSWVAEESQQEET